jgi:hypothetical protein
MKFLFIFLFFPLVSSAQIKIDKAGDFWELRVDSALKVIKSTDSVYYSRILEVCDQISFWKNPFSSCDGEKGKKGTIIISSPDVKSGNIINICAVLVHESVHLKLLMTGMTFENIAEEEIFCYQYELSFLKKIPNVNKNLIRHAEKQIERLKATL